MEFNEDKKLNFTDKNIREFAAGDTIYLKKNESGFTNMYFCKFIRFKQGIVEAEIISGEHNPKLIGFKCGKEIKARITNCYLWGIKPNSRYDFPSCQGS